MTIELKREATHGLPSVVVSEELFKAISDRQRELNRNRDGRILARGQVIRLLLAERLGV